MRNKIDYGIDLGTTNSAIARMEQGKPVVIKIPRNEIMSSCVAINPGRSIIVGDNAYAQFKRELDTELRTDGKEKPNSFIEFKRTMGKDIKYYSPLLNKEFNSEELSAEILKKLKSFITDENVKSIVITVPAKFTMAQNEATLNAAKMAGFEIVELLQEPIAASIAYGLDAKNKNGMWLVFDFGGGTFDAALVSLEEGIMRVLDTDGDNELGGKDLDFAIVDKIIIPHIQENFSIEPFLNDKHKKQILRNAMKSFAEQAKIELSNAPECSIATFPGEVKFLDENNKEVSLNINLNRQDIYSVFEPYFQKAIDITNRLLKKKNLKGSDLECLILVGGPTYSTILQQMLKEQITEKVVAKNQMTSVATGAALYASTIDIGVPPPPPPEGTIALDLKYESATVETDALINLKINSKETSFILPEIVYAVLERGDKSYSSNKVQISSTKATLIEVLLNKNEANYFTIILTDEKGNKIPCQPNNLTITDIHIPDAPLPYNMGIEVWDERKKIKIFKEFRGLEKNKSLKNAVGLIDGIKTPFELIPGRVDQVLRFPLYQGDDEAINKNSFQSNHVTDVIITGENIEKVLPANSDIEITLTFNGSGAIPICSIYFPIIQHTEKIKLGKVEQPQVDTDWLQGEIKSDLERVDTLLELNSNPELEKSRQNLISLKNDFKNAEGSEEGKMKILNNIRKNRTVLDDFESSIEWSESKKEMKSSFFKAEELIDKIKEDGLDADLNMQKIEARLEDFKNKIEDIIRIKDVQMAKEIIEAIDGFILSVVSGIMPDDGLLEKNFIDYTNENFSTLKWNNPTKAREFINQGITNINNNGSLQQLKQLCSKISDLIDRTDPKQPKDIPTI